MNIRTGPRASLSALALLAALAGCAASSAGSGAAAASPATPPADVLFVGNSLTYYNNSLHNHYRALVRAAAGGGGAGGTVRLLAISGGRVAEHRAGLEQMLGSRAWDAVVLQGHSSEPVDRDAVAGFRAAVRASVGLIRAAGARPVLFMTWAYAGRPEMIAALAEAYDDLGRELDVDVVPVGLAFARADAERPAIPLRIADGRHPTLAGTYLAACTMYAALQGRSPEGLDYTAGLSVATARYLQRVAAATVAEHARR